MRIRTLSIIACAAAVFSCGRSSWTTVQGKFGEEVPSEVHLSVADIDTVLAVVDGTFSIKVPVVPYELGLVESDAGRVQFIPDGSVLTADFSGERPRVLSDNTKSLTRAFNAYLDKSVSLINQVVGQDDASKRAYEQYMALQRKTISENGNNFIGLYALQNVYFDYSPEDLKKVISSLGPDLQKSEFVEMISAAADAQIATSEGKMFTDFEIEETQGQKTKLSDYVGNGKYTLVAFWSSWCIPYRNEIPNLLEVYDRFHGQDFDILSVAVWDEDPQESVRVAEELGTPWNNIFNAQRIPTDIYGIQNIPYMILFGSDGTILRRDLRGEAIMDEVSKILAAKN